MLRSIERLAHLVLAVVIFVARAWATQTTPPITAEERYEAARGLMQSGQFIEAGNAFRSIAEEDDVPATLREQALFVCGLMYQSARDYDRAIAVYEEVQRRFPGSAAALRAAGSAGELQSGAASSIEFRRRQDEAWDQMELAIERTDREGLRVARPALKRAEGLLLGLLRDFGDHPKAKDVAMALGKTYMRMQRFVEAQAAFEEAAKRARSSLRSDDPALDLFLDGIGQEIHESILAARRQRITRCAEAVLAAIGLGLLLVAPWRIRDLSIFRVGGGLTVATLALAAVAAALSFVVRMVDVMLPVDEMQAGLLVALPAMVGQVVNLGFIGALQNNVRRGGWCVHGVAGTLGIVAAFAVAICLVNAFELFPFLDSDL